MDQRQGIFDVGFSLETRADVAESFAAGFSVETAYRLSGIDVEVNGQARRSYELVYTTGDNGMRSLLQSITETAFDEDAASLTKPATTFDYSTADRSWSEDASLAGLPVTIAGTGTAVSASICLTSTAITTGRCQGPLRRRSRGLY